MRFHYVLPGRDARRTAKELVVIENLCGPKIGSTYNKRTISKKLNKFIVTTTLTMTISMIANEPS